MRDISSCFWARGSSTFILQGIYIQKLLTLFKLQFASYMRYTPNSYFLLCHPAAVNSLLDCVCLQLPGQLILIQLEEIWVYLPELAARYGLASKFETAGTKKTISGRNMIFAPIIQACVEDFTAVTRCSLVPLTPSPPPLAPFAPESPVTPVGKEYSPPLLPCTCSPLLFTTFPPPKLPSSPPP